MAAATIIKEGFVYRSGKRTPRSMTPRLATDVSDQPGKAGLSAFTTLDDALDPGEKGLKIDVSKLSPPLAAFLESDGHVGIAPIKTDETIDRELLEAWATTRDASEVHPLTAIILNAIDDEVRRPQ